MMGVVQVYYMYSYVLVNPHRLNVQVFTEVNSFRYIKAGIHLSVFLCPYPYPDTASVPVIMGPIGNEL
jgi:hypothetical protein